MRSIPLQSITTNYVLFCCLREREKLHKWPTGQDIWMSRLDHEFKTVISSDNPSNDKSQANHQQFFFHSRLGTKIRPGLDIRVITFNVYSDCEDTLFTGAL